MNFSEWLNYNGYEFSYNSKGMDWYCNINGIENSEFLYNKYNVVKELDIKIFTEGEIKCNKPKQYKIGIDTFARAEANFKKDEILAICKFNIDKYCWRKKDQDKEDFKKIIDYANWALKNL